MRAPSLARACAFAALFVFTAPALGKDIYVPAIPNGNVDACAACHTGGNTSLYNSFGNDSKALVGKPLSQWWPALRTKDSDGDGQKNGQELGDPCGTWAMGKAAPRTTDISNPGDGNSTSADPNTPDCNNAAAGGTGGAGGAGGSGASGGVGGSGASNGIGGADNGTSGGTDDTKSTGAGTAVDRPAFETGACAARGPGEHTGFAGAALIAAAALVAARRRRRG